MAKYQGHRNWNHWNVGLWIGNDEGLYLTAKECIRAHPRNKTAATRALLELLPEKTPDGAPYSFASVRAALVGLE